MLRYTIFVVLFFLSFSNSTFSKDTLSNKNDKWEDYEHKPKRSVLYSLFPGAGQIYNEIGYRRVSQKKHRSWWKVPIIYGALGYTGYMFYDNFKSAKLLKEEILYRRENGATSNLHPELINYADEDALISGYGPQSDFNKGYDEHAKGRDLMLAASIGIYGLNLIEAFVDGHFVSFNVSEDLTLQMQPTVIGIYNPGIKLSFNFN
jgi:hypothetical protein